MDVMYLLHGACDLATTHFQTSWSPIPFVTTGLPVVFRQRMLVSNVIDYNVKVSVTCHYFL